MRIAAYALLAIFACGGSLVAQTPAEPPPADTTAQGQPEPSLPDAVEPPLTPLQERDQQIRQVDPLDRETRDKAKAARDAEKPRPQDQAATPGSIAASEQNSAARLGPQVVEDEQAPVQDYSGPAVLSRTYSVNRQLIPEQLKWQESFGLSSVYDTGISRPVNADGTLGPATTLTGAQAMWSLSGRHYFRRDLFTLNYHGDWSQYSGSGGFNGTNQSITAGYEHALSRHLTLNLSGSGSIMAGNYSLENQPVGPETIANINLASSPNIQIYDTGAKQFSSEADVTWQESSRLSFNMGISYFGIARNSPQLLGVTGQQARGDMNYRLTRQLTVGSYYSFSHYLYPHGVGNSDTNTVGLIASYAFTRTMQIRFRGGLSRVQSLGEQTVRIDPTIAALLGVSSGIIDSSQLFQTTDVSAQFVKDFRGGTTASLAYARGVSPGNGVYQTSQQESMSANLAGRVFRTYSFQVGLGRDSLESVAQNLGKYQSEFGRISLSKAYRRGIGLSIGAEYRYFDVQTLGFLRNQLRITSGVTWNPASGRLWPF